MIWDFGDGELPGHEGKYGTLVYKLPEGIPPFGGNKIKVMNDANRVKIIPGLHVRIVLKKDQRFGKLTEGVVKNILTKALAHPHDSCIRKNMFHVRQTLNWSLCLKHSPEGK